MSDFIRKAMRIGAFQHDLHDRAFDAPAVLDQYGFNVEQLCHLLQDDKVTEIYSHRKHHEKLWRYIEECKKRNIKVIVYFNAHCVEKEQIRQNPDWAQLLPDGSPSLAYGDLIFTCVNSPWKNFFINSVKECLEQDVEGIFLDGPIFSDSGCACKACKELFLKDYGHEITEGTFSECVEFRTKSIRNFVRDVRLAMNEVKPEVILYCNNVGLTQNITGCDIDALFPYVDIIATEGGFMYYYDPNRTSLWKCSQSANYLESKSRGVKPYVIFVAGNTCSWSCSMHTASETKLLFAASVAHGANVWYGIHGPLDMLNTEGGRAAADFNRFLKTNEDLFIGTKRHTKTAIFWSKNTIDTFPEGSEKSDFTREITWETPYNYGNFQSEFRGIYDLLVRNHFDPAIIDELSMEDLSSFSLLILPNVSCMSLETAEKIRKFAEGGGNVIATMATSFCNEKGTPYDQPALAEMFGIESVDRLYATEKLGCVYLDVNDGLSKELRVPHIMAGFDKSFKNHYSAESNTIMEIFTPIEGNYSPMSREKYPSIIETACGKGSVLYISGNIGDMLCRFGIQDVKNLLKFFIEKYSERLFRVENAFDSMEVTLRVQEVSGRMLMHFVNFTGYMARPINHVIPCTNIKVTVKNGMNIKSVRAVTADVCLDFQPAGEDVAFEIPTVFEYELINIESGN